MGTERSLRQKLGLVAKEATSGRTIPSENPLPAGYPGMRYTAGDDPRPTTVIIIPKTPAAPPAPFVKPAAIVPSGESALVKANRENATVLQTDAIAKATATIAPSVLKQMSQGQVSVVCDPWPPWQGNEEQLGRWYALEGQFKQAGLTFRMPTMLPIEAGPTYDPAENTICYNICEFVPTWQPKLHTIRITNAPGAAPVKHWADFPLAMAWAQWAKALAFDEAYIRRLDSASIRTNPRDAGLYEEQLKFIRDGFRAIANFYNTLNIPFTAHPAAVELYKKYLAGQDGSKPSLTRDYNQNNWYSKTGQSKLPGEDPIKHFPVLENRDVVGMGKIPGEARRLFNKLFESGGWAFIGQKGRDYTLEFRQTAGVRVRPYGAEQSPDGKYLDPWMSPQAINEGFAVALKLTYPIMEEPRADVGATRRNRTDIGAEEQRFVYFDAAVTWQNVEEITDWRVFQHDRPFGGTPRLQVTAPLRAYLPYLQEWAAAIAKVRPREILRESRQWVVKRNAAQVSMYESVDQFLQAVGARDQNILQETKGRPNETLKTIAGVVRDGGGTIGSVVGTIVTMTAGAGGGAPGGGGGAPAGGGAGGAGGGADIARVAGQIGQALGGALAQGLDLIAGAVGSTDVNSSSNDEFGRWKPVFERAYLAGDALNEDPTPPPSDMAISPPNFCRPLIDPDDAIDLQESAINPTQEEGGTPPPPPSGMSLPAMVAIAVVTTALVTGGGYAAYHYLSQPAAQTQPKKNPHRARKRRI